MACDSMTLYVKPRFYDFYIRGMMPLQHYWPIRDDSKCTSLKFAVHWGNTHVDKVHLTTDFLHCKFDLYQVNPDFCCV